VTAIILERSEEIKPDAAFFQVLGSFLPNVLSKAVGGSPLVRDQARQAMFEAGKGAGG
jgi:hypothetical protein